MLFSALVLEAVFHQNSEVFFLATTNHPEHGKHRRQRSAGFAAAAVVGKVLGTLVLIGVITCAIMACFAVVYVQTYIIPNAHLDGNFDMNLTSTIYYKDSAGEYVEHLSLHGTENRELVEFEAIPQNLVNATVAIEDERFWTHPGVDWKRTINGVLLMFTGKDIQGGSTITQQLIKNFTQYDDVTVKRKILEIFRALEFDKTYSKEQIMEWYLNYIYLGDNCYGVATAAQNYFGKELDELSLAECASLISITNNPSKYGPNSNLRVTDPDTGAVKTARDFNKERQELVLWKMWDLGMISEEEYRSAVAEELNFTLGVDEEKPAVIYNWYDEQVITDVIQDLSAKYGYSDTLASNMVTSGGLKIYACADPDIQAVVEEVYTNRENLVLTSDSGQQIQSAIVIIDSDGNVVGLAGAMGEKESNRVWNFASRSTRQPGSSIKPLSVYAPALEMGLISPISTFDDYPVQMLGGTAWPANSYLSYRGRMTVTEAVEDSSNPVAVRVLQEVTPAESYQYMAQRFGITTLEQGREVSGKTVSDLGLSQLGLGGLTDGVKVIEMAGAYSVFQRGGLYVRPRTYLRVTDDAGNILLDNSQREDTPVLKTSTVWYINNLLKQVVQSGTGTQAKISGMTVAGKTGSTTSNNDRWFVGYTPYYTAAVWVGYELPERIRAGGSNPAAVLWQKVMSQVHAGLENRELGSKPDDLITVQYCLDSGMRATEACTHDVRGSRVATATILRSDAPLEDCSLHTDVEVCTDSPILDDSGSPIAGLYHLAGEFCPREGSGGLNQQASVKTVSVLDYVRENMGGKAAADGQYLLGYLEAQGTCDVHTSAIEAPPEEYDPYLFDVTDPSTWPTQEQWPGFDPANPSTYPTIPTAPPATESPEPSEPPQQPDYPLGPSEPETPPPDEPYVPADGAH